MRIQRRTFHRLALASAFALASASAFAQAWPSRPIKLVLSHPAGSGVDVIGRALAESLARDLGQSVVVENKPGGQNTIGAAAAARSPADGYTIYFATVAALVTNQYLFKSLPYDPRKDFTSIGFVGSSPFGVFVAAGSPIKSLQDLIARAKAAPEKVSVASQGPKSFAGITSRVFAARAGVKLNQVAYVAIGVALQDLMGGHTDVLFSDIASAAELTRQGKLRILAVASDKRIPEWDAPAIAEQLPGFDMQGWFALVAPKATPADIIRRFNRALESALADPEIKDKIHRIGPVTHGAGTPEQLEARLAIEHKNWAELSKEIGLLPE